MDAKAFQVHTVWNKKEETKLAIQNLMGRDNCCLFGQTSSWTIINGLVHWTFVHKDICPNG